MQEILLNVMRHTCERCFHEPEEWVHRQAILSLDITRGHPVFAAEVILYDTYHGSKICESKL